MPVDKEAFDKAEETSDTVGSRFGEVSSFIGFIKFKAEVKEYGDWKQKKFFMVLTLEATEKEQKFMVDAVHHTIAQAGDKVLVDGIQRGEWVAVHKRHTFRLLEKQAKVPTPDSLDFRAEYITNVKVDKDGTTLFRWSRRDPIFCSDREVELIYIEEKALHEFLWPEQKGGAPEPCEPDHSYHERFGFHEWHTEGQKNGKYFRVRKILKVKPVTDEFIFEVPLAQLYYGDGFVDYTLNVHGKSVFGRIQGEELPFDTAPVLNKVKAAFEGFVRISGHFLLRGRWNWEQKQAETWWEPTSGEQHKTGTSYLAIKWDMTKIDQIKRVFQDWQGAQQYKELLAELRKQKVWNLAEALNLYAKSGGVTTEEEVIKRFWRGFYIIDYYNHLRKMVAADHDDDVWMTTEYFVFAIGDRVVIERPEYGAATYVFKRPQNVPAFLAMFDTTSKLVIINDQTVQQTLGFTGRAIHDDFDMWKLQLDSALGKGGWS